MVIITQALVARLQRRLNRYCRLINRKQQIVVPWNWICRQVIQLDRQYPGGITETILLAELVLLLHHDRELQNAIATYDVAHHETIRFEDIATYNHHISYSQVLVGYVKQWIHSGRIIELCDKKSNTTLDLILHQRFQVNTLPLLNLFMPNRKIALTGIRMLPNSNSTAAIRRILPTEHMLFELHPSLPDDREFLNTILRQNTLSLSFEADQLHSQVICCKIKSIQPEVPSTRHGHKKQQIISIEIIDPDEKQSISSTQIQLTEQSHQLILWDHQIVASVLLFEGQDVIIYHPYIHIENDEWFLEYGSNTVLFSLSSALREETFVQTQVKKATTILQDMRFSSDRFNSSMLKDGLINVGLLGTLVEWKVSRDTTTSWYQSFLRLHDIDHFEIEQHHIVELKLDIPGDFQLDIELSGEAAAVLSSTSSIGDSIFITGLVLASKDALEYQFKYPATHEALKPMAMIGIGAEWQSLCQSQSSKFENAKVFQLTH